MNELLESAPFPIEIHIKTPEPSHNQQVIINELKDKLRHHELYQQFESWLTNDIFMRFLISRNFDLHKAYDLLIEALKWRSFRRPELLDNHIELFKKESETGKIYCPGLDKWGRCIIVFDNTVQNTHSSNDHMNFLAWSLEFAIKQMIKENKADKYVVFMNLKHFSLFNCPSFKETTETIQMLCNCYPERLGHCIAYCPPSVFKIVFNGLKSFIDPKTVSKIVFLSGDVSADSEIDKKMKNIIGDNWKELTGAEQPVYQPHSSPGFKHENYWPTVIERMNSFQSRANDI